MPLPILVVFDIDETLLQFMNKGGPYRLWQGLSDERKAAFTYSDTPEKEQCAIFRPHLKEFFEFVQNTPYVKIALWTYSEQQYAYDMAKLMIKTFGLTKDPFVFKYGAEQVEEADEDYPKNLNYIWNDPKFGGKYNKFNTFLIDDKLSNLAHISNKLNSILVDGFKPFGVGKGRGPITTPRFQHAIEDDAFIHLIDIIKKIHADISGCSEGEIEDAFSTEHIFPNRAKCNRKGLSNYMKSHYLPKRDTDVLMVTIGDIDLSDQHVKGGRRRNAFKSTRRGKNLRSRTTKKNRGKTTRRRS
jgi:hypothetical protein